MDFQKLNNVLLEKGFTGKHATKALNDNGEYIGDLLESLGFVKVIEIKHGRTWVEFDFDGVRMVGHREANEAKKNSQLNPMVYFSYLIR